MDEKPTHPLKLGLLPIFFVGIATALSQWLFGDPIPGIVVGLIIVFGLSLLVMISDLIAINKELASVRKGDKIE